MSQSRIVTKHLGIKDYQPVYDSMRDYTINRNTESDDQLWFLQHKPVFTQGLNGQAEHIINPHNIPVIQTDRGGQVTYHGPGQITCYLLLDLERHGLGVKSLVSLIETAIIETLAHFSITAGLKNNAPGVYVDDKKIASLGLKITKQKSYHGLALNVDMDKTPFSYINPCGFQRLEMTQVSDYNATASFNNVLLQLEKSLITRLHD